MALVWAQFVCMFVRLWVYIYSRLVSIADWWHWYPDRPFSGAAVTGREHLSYISDVEMCAIPLMCYKNTFPRNIHRDVRILKIILIISSHILASTLGINNCTTMHQYSKFVFAAQNKWHLAQCRQFGAEANFIPEIRNSCFQYSTHTHTHTRTDTNIAHTHSQSFTSYSYCWPNWNRILFSHFNFQFHTRLTGCVICIFDAVLWLPYVVVVYSLFFFFFRSCNMCLCEF